MQTENSLRSDLCRSDHCVGDEMLPHYFGNHQRLLATHLSEKDADVAFVRVAENWSSRCRTVTIIVICVVTIAMSVGSPLDELAVMMGRRVRAGRSRATKCRRTGRQDPKSAVLGRELAYHAEIIRVNSDTLNSDFS